MEAAILSKGAFADLCRVDKSRVSQWIKEGKLDGPALVGEGRSARINVQVAQQQLKDRIDVGQRMGNGLKTKLDTPTMRPAALPATGKKPAPMATSSFPASVWSLIHEVPALAVWEAVGQGASMPTAYVMFFGLALSLRTAAEQTFGAPLPAEFEVPGWSGLAEEHGLSFDLAECEAKRRAYLDAP